MAKSNASVDDVKLVELEDKLAQAQLENEQLREELDRLHSAPVVHSAPALEVSNLVEELRILKKDLNVTKGELQVALDVARTAAGLNIPKTQPVNPKDVVRVPQPLGPDGKELPPPAGAVLKKFRVTLQHAGTKIVELWEVPGTGFASNGIAKEAFNKALGVGAGGSTYPHEIAEVTGPEVVATAPVASKTFDTWSPEARQAIETGALRDPVASRMAAMMAEVS